MQHDLREILAALELPPHALEAWLRELETFCREHGGEPRYHFLMALLRECREASR
jgi:hypothetical protein